MTFNAKPLRERGWLVSNWIDVIPALPDFDSLRALVPGAILVLDHPGHYAVQRSIKNIPMPKLSVPPEIDKGTGGDTPHRHTDVHKGIAVVTPRLTTLEDRALPFLGKILLSGNNFRPSLGRELFKNGRAIRP